jgi:Uri superfamily endonuclease
VAITNRNTVDGGYRWHIDQLLRTATTFTAVYAGSRHRTECLLIRYLKELGLLVIVGFGSTDCSSGCGGHLVYLPEGDIEEAKDVAVEGFRHLGLEPIVGNTYMREES